MTDHPDFLRSPKNIFDPDPRSLETCVVDKRGIRAKTFEDQHQAVAEIAVHKGAPEAVVIKFETAKNLSLFSWFVYRFHSAARSHAYECLELGLRTRFKDELYDREEARRRERHENKRMSNSLSVEPYQPMDKQAFRPMLHMLLRYAVEVGVLKNENFSAWQTKTRVRALHRRSIELIEKMQTLGLTELEIDDAQLDITAEDRDHDYLGKLLDSVPFLRNHYAHGTSALDGQSLSALRVVAEIINQIFAETGPEEVSAQNR